MTDSDIISELRRLRQEATASADAKAAQMTYLAALWDHAPALLDTLERYRAALEAIASNKTPCADCGKVHESWEKKPNHEDLAPQWSDPDDGHPYWRTSAAEFAHAALHPEEAS